MRLTNLFFVVVATLSATSSTTTSAERYLRSDLDFDDGAIMEERRRGRSWGRNRRERSAPPPALVSEPTTRPNPTEHMTDEQKAQYFVDEMNKSYAESLRTGRINPPR